MLRKKLQKLKRDSSTAVFLRNLQIFKNTFFYRAPLVAASKATQETRHFVYMFYIDHFFNSFSELFRATQETRHFVYMFS